MPFFKNFKQHLTNIFRRRRSASAPPHNQRERRDNQRENRERERDIERQNRDRARENERRPPREDEIDPIWCGPSTPANTRPRSMSSSADGGAFHSNRSGLGGAAPAGASVDTSSSLGSDISKEGLLRQAQINLRDTRSQSIDREGRSEESSDEEGESSTDLKPRRMQLHGGRQGDNDPRSRTSTSSEEKEAPKTEAPKKEAPQKEAPQNEGSSKEGSRKEGSRKEPSPKASSSVRIDPPDLLHRCYTTSSSEALDTESDGDECIWVPKCHCSSTKRNPPFFTPPIRNIKITGVRFPPFHATQMLHDEREREEAREREKKQQQSEDQARESQRVGLPSTSQQSDPDRLQLERERGPCCSDDTVRNNFSLEDEMEDLVNKLKSRGSLGPRRSRSRSRSRRSRARQGFGTGVVVITDLNLIHNYPLRETDSDDSNTESRTSLCDVPPPFLTFPRQASPVLSNDQSSTSFHSVMESNSAVVAQTSGTANRRETGVGVDGEEEEEDEEGEGRVDGDVTASNRSRNVDVARPGSSQTPPRDPYGADDFVLDLMLAMCRGTWSDIL